MKKRVFISSTFRDLEKFREAVRLRVRQLGAEDVAMEYFGARDERPKQECMRMVAEESDYFVGIYAHRYGFIPPGDSVSVSESEYDAATAAGIPRLIYVVKDTAPWPDEHRDTDENESKLKGLKARVSEYIRDSFSEAHELAGKVVADLGREFSQAPVPRHLGALRLEPPITDFVGREEDLRALRAKMPSGNVLLSAVRGMGGIGKTQLARKLATELRPAFDLTLELNLQGVSAETALSPHQALTKLINAIIREGSDLPDDTAKLASLWQDCLRKHRLLLLLDNASGAAQVLPILPKSPGHHVIITSRKRFTLPGLQAFDLGALNQGESRRLLQEINSRLNPEDADAIAKECAYLPLALRLAGSFLANRDDLPVGTYLADLQSRRLALLNQAAEECGEPGITATLSLSYESASTKLQRRWRMLGVFPGSFDLAAAAAVWAEADAGPTPDAAAESAQSCLAELRRLSLIGWNPTEQRYVLHDLVRDFIRNYLTPEESFGAHLRFARHFQGLLARLDREAFTPVGIISRPVIDIFQLELGNLSTGWEWCVQQTPIAEPAVQTLAGFCDNSGELMAAFTSPTLRIALYGESSTILPANLHPRAALMARFALARAHYDRGDEEGSIEASHILPVVITEAERIRETETMANARMFYGRLFRRQGQNDQALAEHARAVDDARGLGNPIFLTKALSQLSRTRLDCDLVPEAEASNLEATGIAKTHGYSQYLTGCSLTAARILNLKAAVEKRRGRADRQRDLLNQAVALGDDAIQEARKIGAIKLLNIAVFSLGRTLRFREKGDDHLRALACFEESLKLNQQLGNIRGEAGAFLDIGEIQRIINRPGDALRSLKAGLELQRRASNKLGEAQTLESLIKLLWNTDRPQAEELLKQCREVYQSPALKRYGWQWKKFEGWLAKHQPQSQ